MVYQVFTVFDGAIQLYLPPFFCRTEAEAIRSVRSAMSDPGHTFTLHAEDYVLYKLGDYIEATGAFDLLPSPALVASLVGLKSQKGVNWDG